MLSYDALLIAVGGIPAVAHTPERLRSGPPRARNECTA